jgi:S-adenosylmethionine synthetase
MSAQVVVEPLAQPEVGRRGVEIVERKGRGHPDTLCDAAAEALSAALCREYVARTGRIQHHNVDKAALCAGAADVEPGGGTVTAPMRLIHVGRATQALEGTSLDLEALATASAREVFGRSLRHLDAARHLRIELRIRPTSRALRDLFAAAGAVPLANDSSIGCGYAPLSETERLVLETDRFLMLPATLDAHPYLGEDVKLLAVRVGDAIDLTVAAAFVAAQVPSVSAYVDAKNALAAAIRDHAARISARVVRVSLNAADDPPSARIYLTVTGTSAEAGDDGQVGRGNRANGLITPSRPMSLEAVAGKNPVSHVGKLYNTWAQQLASELAARPDLAAVSCQLASRIGAPITEPQVVWLGVSGPAARDASGLAAHVQTALERLPAMWRELLHVGWQVA